MRRIKLLAIEVPDGALFYAPDLLDGERRMTFYRRSAHGVTDVNGYIQVRRLGLMQFRESGAKRVNIRVSAAGAPGLLAAKLPVVQIFVR